MTRERIVITGIGAVTPFGAGVEVLWRGLDRGKQPIERVELFDVAPHRTHLAATVPGDALELPTAVLARHPSRTLSRTDRFALIAAHEAWVMAELGEPGSVPAAGLFFGSSTGGMFEGERAYRALVRSRPERARARAFAAQPNGTPAEEIARVFGLGGPTETLATACSASTMALEAALDALRAGETAIALAGGSDGLCQTTFGGFNSLRAVDPGRARPFRADRAGLSLGEGAGLLVLETESHARARGARPLAMFAGAASTCDASHMTAPHPEGLGAARAMTGALADAGLAATSIAFINAHGSGTPHNDAAEARAIRAVFGASAPPVTSTKGSIGHSLGACGSIEAIVTLLSLVRESVHPTPGDGPVDVDAEVDLVLGAPRALRGAEAALSVNLAFGGANAALVIARPEVRS
ncbi:MAG: beta-ketoacyl-[acyl-carrier-protein] synthase family protein [Planctomycetota bacterium]